MDNNQQASMDEGYIDNAPQDPYLRHSDGEPFMSYYVARKMDESITYVRAENALLRRYVDQLRARREELHEQIALIRRNPGRCSCGHLNDSCDLPSAPIRDPLLNEQT